MHRGKTITVLAIACIGAGVVGATGWHHYTHSPQYALRQIADAAREHNRLKFEQYVDLERFSASTVDEVMARSTLASVDEAKTGFGALGAMLGAGMVEKMKPALASEMRAAILNAVENGRFDSLFAAKQDTASRDLTLAVVARNMSADGTRFAGMGTLQREGDVATVGLKLHNEILDTTLVLRVRLDRGPDRWRVVAPDNLRDYLKAVDDLQHRHLAEVNHERHERMLATLDIGPVERRVRTYEWLSDDVILSARVRNTGQDTVTGVLLSLFVDGEAMDNSDISLGTFDPIPPGKSGTAVRVLDYNQFIDWHKRVRYGDHLRAEPWAIITRRGAAQDTLYEYGSWSEYASRL